MFYLCVPSVPGGGRAAVPHCVSGSLRGATLHHIPMHHGPQHPQATARCHWPSGSTYGESVNLILQLACGNIKQATLQIHMLSPSFTLAEGQNSN